MPNPPAPTNLRVVQTNRDSVWLQWSGTSSGIASYRVQYGLTPVNKWSWGGDTSQTVLLVDQLECKGDYAFRVGALGDGKRYKNTRTYSAAITETTTDCPLDAPTGLTSREYSDSAERRILVLDWDDVAGTGITYKVRLRDADRVWTCVPAGISVSCNWAEHPWITLSPISSRSDSYSITFNGSEAEVKYPVDGREYEHQVRSVKENRESGWSAKWTTKMPAAIPHLGHQQDHTVKYEPSSTHPPSKDISNAIGIAVSAWERAVGQSWPNLSFCRYCGDKNTDGHTVRIDAVSGEKSPGKGSEEELLWASIPYLGDADCGAKTACVKPRGVGDAGAFVNFRLDGGESAPWQHMENLTMVIEDPPWSYNKKSKHHTEYEWTDDHSRHGLTSPSGIPYRYLPAVIMHEFGHALGLTDLYEYPGQYPGYLMDSTDPKHLTFGTTGQPAVPQSDIDYVKQVYRNAHGTEPH